MRTITATQASRSFAALLDGAERGETVVITRGGRRVAVIGPSSAGNGAEVRALVRGGVVDVDFADDVRAARDAVDDRGPAWPPTDHRLRARFDDLPGVVCLVMT